MIYVPSIKQAVIWFILTSSTIGGIAQTLPDGTATRAFPDPSNSALNAKRAEKICLLGKMADDAAKIRAKTQSPAEVSEFKRTEAKSRLLVHLLEKRSVTPGLKKQIDDVRADRNLTMGQRFEIAQIAEIAQRHEKKFASRAEWLAEREAGAQQLVKEFPHEARAYSNLLGVALQSSPERALPLARQILDSSTDTETKDRARALATRVTIDGRYLTDVLDGTPGSSAFVAQTREQLVVLYTWQPEAPASIVRAQELGGALPVNAKSYGINLSRAIPMALKIAEEKNLPGAQLGSGRGHDHPIATRLGLTDLGGVYVISRDGRLHNLSNAADLRAALVKFN